MPPECEGSVKYLGTVTTDGGGHAQLQLLAVHLMDFLQVGQHLLTHGVFEHQETPRLGTLVVFPLSAEWSTALVPDSPALLCHKDTAQGMLYPLHCVLMA